MLVDCRKCDMYLSGTSCVLYDSILNLTFGSCSHYKERKEMSIQTERYVEMQKDWVELYDVRVGDLVRILRVAKNSELGCCYWESSKKRTYVGNTYRVTEIVNDHLQLSINDSANHCWPFFCLEFVSKGQPTIEITCRVNGVVSTLKDVSEETLLKIRKQS